MKTKSLFLALVLLFSIVGVSFGDTYTDEISVASVTAKKTLTSGNYTSIASINFTSDAEYTAKVGYDSGKGALYLSTNRPWATKTSGGVATHVKIYWLTDGSNSASSKLTIYGKSSKYTYATSTSSVTTDGSVKVGEASYTGTATTDIDLSAEYEYIVILGSSTTPYFSEIDITWEKASLYNITVDDPVSNGTIEVQSIDGDDADLSKAAEDASVLVAFMADDGYELSEINVIGDDSGDDYGISFTPAEQTDYYEYEFAMPAEDVTITATFVTAAVRSAIDIYMYEDESDIGTPASAVDAVTIKSGNDKTIYFEIPGYDGAKADLTLISGNTANVTTSFTYTPATQSGTITLTGWSIGSPSLTLLAAQTAGCYEGGTAITVNVVRRPVALVTEYEGKYYAVTSDLSGTKFVPMETLSDDGNYYFDPSGSYDASDVTWYIETIYNAYGNRYHIFSGSSGSEQIYVDGGDFFLATDERIWKKDGDNFYGYSDDRGIVFNSTNSKFEARNYESYESLTQFSQSAFEVPIANIVQARRFSSYDDEDIIDERSFSIGQLATICVPFNAPLSFAHGATFYRLTGKTVSGDNLTAIIMEEVEGNLEGGGCYMMEMTATELDIYGGVEVDEASKDASDGFLGRGGWEPSALPATGGVTPRKNGYYGLKSNQLHYIAAGSNPTPKAYRAYVNAGELSAGGGSSSPRRRVLTVYGAENVATDLSNVNDASLINWNEPVYNIMGMQVAKGATGVLIQNGQKFLAQ